MSRVSSLLAAGVFAVAASGCVTYPQTYYYPGGAGGYVDERDSGYYDNGDYYYGSNDYYADSWGWPYYYSVLYPAYSRWYDPYWSPYYYYGVTYFPSTWYGIGIGYWDAWPYYHAYSPYRYSFWDNYYDWYDYDHDDHHGHHGRHGDRYDQPHWRDGNGRHGGRYGQPRYGSARNEAERIAHLMGADRDAAGAKAAATRGRRAASTGDWRDVARSGALADAPRSYGGAAWRGRGGERAVTGVATYAGQVEAGGGSARGQIQRFQPSSGSQPAEATSYAPRTRGSGPSTREAYVYPRESAARGQSAQPGWVGSMPPSRGTPQRSTPDYRERSSAGSPRTWEAPGEPRTRTYAPSPRYGSVPSPGYDNPDTRHEDPRARSGGPYAPAQDYRAPRSEPRYATPRSEPGYSAPRSEPGYSGPRSEPSYVAPARSYEAPARSYEAPRSEPRSDSGGHNRSSGGGSSRGQSEGRSRGGSRNRDD